MQEKKDALRSKFLEIKEAIQLRREEAKSHAEGQAKAQWAITLCTRRVSATILRITINSTGYLISLDRWDLNSRPYGSQLISLISRSRPWTPCTL